MEENKCKCGIGHEPDCVIGQNLFKVLNNWEPSEFLGGKKCCDNGNFGDGHTCLKEPPIEKPIEKCPDEPHVDNINDMFCGKCHQSYKRQVFGAPQNTLSEVAKDPIIQEHVKRVLNDHPPFSEERLCEAKVCYSNNHPGLSFGGEIRTCCKFCSKEMFDNEEVRVCTAAPSLSGEWCPTCGADLPPK